MSESNEGRRLLEPWLRVGVIVLSQMAALVLVVALFQVPGLAARSEGPVGVAVICALGLWAAVGAVALYERPRSMAEFWGRLGLLRPGKDVVGYVVGGLVYGLAVCYLLRHSEGLQRAAEGSRLFSLPDQGSLGWKLFAMLLLMGAVLEEVFMRGFLFRSFLKNYGLAAGTGCTVMLGVLMHWRGVSVSTEFLGFFAVYQAGLCLIWWRRGNLWYCIAAHGGYNLAVALFPAIQAYLAGR